MASGTDALQDRHLDGRGGIYNLNSAAKLRGPQFVNAISGFYSSSIGKKMIVAITGVILILFVVGHLLGNLQIFLGPEWINGYSQHLRDLGPLLWLIRGFLLIAVALHIYFTILLAIENRRARPKHYKGKHHV